MPNIQERIFAAADALVSKGHKPTQQAIRKALGGKGSYTTIAKSMREWYGKRKDADPLTPLINKLNISMAAIEQAMQKVQTVPSRALGPPLLPPGVVPKGVKMAFDEGFCTQLYGYANSGWQQGDTPMSRWGIGFPGYPYLSELSQISEFRAPAEITSIEMTRQWIKIISKSQTDGKKVKERIKTLNEEMQRHGIQELFRKMELQDCFFGRSQFFIDLNNASTDIERQSPLVISSETIPKNSLIRFQSVESLWTTPYAYNSGDPTRDDFFVPQSWYIMGRQIHASRMCIFIGRPLPDMLKPAYNFGGLSLSQLIERYVQRWLKGAEAVAELLRAFSITGIMMDMGTILQGDTSGQVFKRIELFNKTRDNRGTMLLDKESEEFFQFNTPLSGVDKLLAQLQEHMASPCHLTLQKLFGITPVGLNASSSEENEVGDDYIHARQEMQFRAPLKRVMDIIQLDQFGDIDEDIDFEFNPLREMSAKELAEIRKSDAEADAIYITAGVLDRAEAREKIALDPMSGYDGINVDKLPEMPDMMGEIDEDLPHTKAADGKEE